jgi:hypothetical protein
MKVLRALLGGLLGAAAMSVVMALCRLALIPIDLELLLGSFVLAELGFGAWLVGVGIHLSLGALFGLLYAWIFERGMQRSGPAAGAAIGMLHAGIAGAALAALPEVHPLVPIALVSPGAYFVALGSSGVMLFVLLHLLFGGVVGAYYGQVESGRAPFAPRRISPTHF